MASDYVKRKDVLAMLCSFCPRVCMHRSEGGQFNTPCELYRRMMELEAADDMATRALRALDAMNSRGRALVLLCPEIVDMLANKLDDLTDRWLLGETEEADE